MFWKTATLTNFFIVLYEDKNLNALGEKLPDKSWRKAARNSWSLPF